MDAKPAIDRSFEVLQRFARRQPPAEMCDLCGDAVSSGHQHLINPVERRLICACDPCSILFSQQSTPKYKRVPRRVRLLTDLLITEGQWDGLGIPIGLAFLFRSTARGRVLALYPSPAGATESLLPLETWNDLEESNPVLGEMEPDVEALLVNRVGSHGSSGGTYYLAPIDVCYGLVAIIRTHWRGFSGGTELWEHVDRFFADLEARAEVTGEVPRA